ncbi:MAG: GNAT family N-acetyltransferase [Gammaproteobacteria bacterium]|nr:GNAT family N-acetyltransferase [Gammaproteobacteria bacterium]MCY4356122.1 GNAT family N-acetyltransferase [Gammaproteobacteria bacterium]
MNTQMNDSIADYPLHLNMNGKDIVLRTMTVNDGSAMFKFARGLPTHDILFMRRNIAKQSGIDKWIRDIEKGLVYSIVALLNNEIVGYSTIHLNELDWTRHVAELRVSVSLDLRKHGLGRTLIREGFKLAVTLGVEIITSRMTPDQKAARTLFEELGFRNEAVLKDHMKDQKGQYHDLLVMAVNVDEFLARRQAYGLT